MKFDFSYTDKFFATIDRGEDIAEIANTIAYKTIQKHVQMTGSEFSLSNIQKAMNGDTNAGYGLRNLPQNLTKIRELNERLKERITEWKGIIKKGVTNIFGDYDFNNTVICPVIGYDIGIGIDDVVCINLNTSICLKDIKEVFSIAIHETTHTVSKNIHGMIFNHESKQNILNTVNYLIQYEGLGIFSAYNYRCNNRLSNTGFVVLEDYNINNEQYDTLIDTYQKLVCYSNDPSKSIDDMLKIAYSGRRLTHRLGYALVYKEFNSHGINGVRKIALMSSNEFATMHLY